MVKFKQEIKRSFPLNKAQCRKNSYELKVEEAVLMRRTFNFTETQRGTFNSNSLVSVFKLSLKRRSCTWNSVQLDRG